jgi:hypothetical protein
LKRKKEKQNKKAYTQHSNGPERERGRKVLRYQQYTDGPIFCFFNFFGAVGKRRRVGG